ncbi:hypothetical protein NDU88_011222 [Pleurodeles waltl]|uniref:Uncharacterized protein n=1 Tax=Pleurodeles waltl TaxID=8319 RepID=A0AAV7PX58_PLEWA|nr:hypothetical protein NDU88_011222 [Pleurodeles waltl]
MPCPIGGGGEKEGSGPHDASPGRESHPGETPGGAARPTGSQGASGGASAVPIQAEKAPEEHRLNSGPAVEGGVGGQAPSSHGGRPR